PFSPRLSLEKSTDLSTPQLSSPENGRKNADRAPTITAGSSHKLTLTDAERKRIIEEERARLETFVSTARKHTFSNSDMDVRATEDPLRQFNSDAEFADLLSALTQTFNLLCASSISSDLKESSTSDPFGSGQKPTNFRTPSLPTVSISPNCLPWNPFLSTSSSTSVSVSNGLATAVNTWNSRTSQYTPFGPPNINVTNQAEPNAGIPPKMNDPASATLDARLAQIAGNLTIGTEVRSPSGVYRAPDGSLTSVNWTGTLQPIPTGPDPARPTQIRSSVSMNQLTGPVFPPATGATNPWYPIPSTYRPACITGPVYNTATYSSSASTWMTPSFQPSTAQTHPVSASVTGSANVVRSTNPFL
ncbi:phosphatidylinositol-binding clathrin assembly protein, partial [Paragonimus westermani]